MKGALPPSSSPTFFTPEAACRISSLPTSVEPVKPTKRTAGCSQKTLPIAGGVAGDDVQHARRQTGALRQFAQRQRGERRLRRRLDHAGAAGGQAPGAHLRVIIAAGKFHGVIAAITPIGWRKVRMRASGQGEGMVSP